MSENLQTYYIRYGSSEKHQVQPDWSPVYSKGDVDTEIKRLNAELTEKNCCYSCGRTNDPALICEPCYRKRYSDGDILIKECLRLNSKLAEAKRANLRQRVEDMMWMKKESILRYRGIARYFGINYKVFDKKFPAGCGLSLINELTDFVDWLIEQGVEA